MSDPGLRQSPLSEFFTEFNPNMVRPEVGISITEKPFLGYLNLRAEPDAEMITLIEQASGIRLPIEQNTFTRNARTDAICWARTNGCLSCLKKTGGLSSVDPQYLPRSLLLNNGYHSWQHYHSSLRTQRDAIIEQGLQPRS